RLLPDAPAAGELRAKARHDLLVEQGEGDAPRAVIDDEADAVGTDVDDRSAAALVRGEGAGADRRRDAIEQSHGRAMPAQGRSRKLSLGTASLFLSAAPRPESDGFVMK